MSSAASKKTDAQRPSVFDNLFYSLPDLHTQHSPQSPAYQQLKQQVKEEVRALFSGNGVVPQFGPFGSLKFPYVEMGNISTLNLFEMDELIIFSFYWLNRRRYQRVLDIGANLGLHSIILDKCGYSVSAYEPDPTHFKILNRNLESNNCKKVKTFNAAVSSRTGTMEFVRVLGNTTGSHLAGSKPNPYGRLEKFPVPVVAIRDIIVEANLIKLDAEGHEKEILTATSQEHWLNLDALVEISHERNARAVYDHFAQIKVGLFSQKTNWQKVSRLEDMPMSHHEGTLFVTMKTAMPWMTSGE